MRIAIPVTGGLLAEHFGHCERFAMFDIDTASRQVKAVEEVPAPPHEPGLLPPWLGQRGVQVVIASGMGTRAQSLFRAASIEVHPGAPIDTAETLVNQYLTGTLVTAPKQCKH